MSGAPETRQSLIVRLSDHQDELAWQEFVDLYQPLILRMARRHGLQEADAVEVTQDILLCVAQAVDRWTPSGTSGSFRAWLFRIARNLLINYLSRKKEADLGSGDSGVRAMLESQPSPTNPLSAEFDLEYRRRMFHWAAQRVRTQVRPETWQAFWKNSVEGRNAGDVATELGVPTGNIYVARCRVMHRLRMEIERVADSESGLFGAQELES